MDRLLVGRGPPGREGRERDEVQSVSKWESNSGGMEWERREGQGSSGDWWLETNSTEAEGERLSRCQAVRRAVPLGSRLSTLDSLLEMRCLAA